MIVNQYIAKNTHKSTTYSVYRYDLDKAGFVT